MSEFRDANFTALAAIKIRDRGFNVRGKVGDLRDPSKCEDGTGDYAVEFSITCPYTEHKKWVCLTATIFPVLKGGHTVEILNAVYTCDGEIFASVRAGSAWRACPGYSK